MAVEEEAVGGDDVSWGEIAAGRASDEDAACCCFKREQDILVLSTFCACNNNTLRATRTRLTARRPQKGSRAMGKNIRKLFCTNSQPFTPPSLASRSLEQLITSPVARPELSSYS